MGATKSSLNIETDVETLTSNDCGNVSCDNSLPFSIVSDGPIVVSGLKFKQNCRAKAVCQFKSMLDQTVNQMAALQATTGAGATGIQVAKRDFRERIVNQLQNKCASTKTSNSAPVYLQGKSGVWVSDTVWDQVGDAELRCQINTISQMKAAVEDNEKFENTGMLKFLENLTGNPLFVIVLGVVALKVLAGSGSGSSPSFMSMTPAGRMLA